jgi:hypothetical protein
MLEDCFKYYKGCQACQRFGKIQIVPASVMNPIIKPWPFRGWGMDMIGKINPPSSKGCRVLSGCPPRGIPKVVGFRLGCAEIRNSKVQTTQDLDRFRLQYA